MNNSDAGVVMNLEVEMRRELGVGHADFPDYLPLDDELLRAHVGFVEGAVDRIVAAAVIDDHGEAVRAELADVDDSAWRDGGDADRPPFR